MLPVPRWAPMVAVLCLGCAAPSYVAGRRAIPPPLADVVHAEERVGTADGESLLVQSWRPKGPVRAVVVAVHGLKDYGDRYAEFAHALALKGYLVVALDLRGHGDSTGRRVWVEAFDQYLDDVDLVVKRTRIAEHGKPVFLFGHSMGGAIATLYALTRQPAPDGLLLSGAALKTDASGVEVLSVKLFSSLAPMLAVFSLDDSKFSRDPKVVASMKTDPLVFDGAAPARTAAQVVTSIERIRDHCKELTVPLLAMHGTADAVTPPSGSRELVDCVKSKDKAFKPYEGLFHDLLHEPERAQVTADVLQWLDAHSGG